MKDKSTVIVIQGGSHVRFKTTNSGPSGLFKILTKDKIRTVSLGYAPKAA